MGSTNQIQELNYLLDHLRGLKCTMCKQLFTEEELRDGNFDLWFSNHSNIEWKVESSGEYWMGARVRYVSHKQITEREQKYFSCPNIKKKTI